MSVEGNYLRRAAEICAELENAYKIRLLEEVVKPMINAGLISGPSGHEFWYASKTFEEIIDSLGSRFGLDNLFPIPTNCGTWFNAEIDPLTSKPFRFFNCYAWLDVKLSENSNFIKITLAHYIDENIFSKLTLKSEDLDFPLYKRDTADIGHVSLYFLIPRSLKSKQIIRLEIETEISEIPALMYEDNSDWRRLSAAIFYPECVE
jgi:hypothetical protein